MGKFLLFIWNMGKKKLIVVATTNLYNLKSNTMKNTVQI